MKIIISPILLFLTNYIYAQNLVPNPGFEDFFVCPQTINSNKTNNKIAPHWNSPNYGTPDLFNKCSKYQMGVQNKTGVTDPYEGEGFAGIVIWEGKKGYREYLQVKLTEPLKQGQMYTISFQYKLSSYSKYSADRIGFLLNDTSFFYKLDSAIPLSPTYCKIKPKIIDIYTGTWELIEAEYKANGNEKYLTIGNFDDNNTTKTIHLSSVNSQEPMLEHAAYYYIDDLMVIGKKINADTVASKAPIINGRIASLSESYILQNVQFEYDSDILLPNAYKELDEIISILKTYPDWKIKILGHTDNRGSVQYNLALSERRAYSVKKYLIENGISKEKIESKGYGKTKPLIKGSDEKSQKINRRVEIQFTK